MENKQTSQREASPEVPPGAETAKRLQGHDRLRSHLAGRCSKRPEEPQDERSMAKPVIALLNGIDNAFESAYRFSGLS
jgi:hypothetical protein